jgi:hypothetical protein
MIRMTVIKDDSSTRLDSLVGIATGYGLDDQREREFGYL